MKNFYGFISAVLLAALAANAVPAKRGFRSYTQPDGTVIEAELIGDEFGHFYLSKDKKPMLCDANGFLQYATINTEGEISLSQNKVPVDLNLFVETIDGRRMSRASARAQAPARVAPQNGLGLFSGNYPRTGKVNALVFLVEYSDVKFSISDPKKYFTDMLNKEGFAENGATGSARDYFLEQSGNKFQPTFDVFGPVTLKNKRSYYGGNNEFKEDKNPEQMAVEAAAQLAGTINFANYDFDNDGYVDNIIVVYAGKGEADGGPAESVWPHSWEIPNGKTYNGKKISGYCCISELEGNGANAPIGTFVHEYSHVMGLPDLYHTASLVYYTPGEYSVLDYGPYNNSGHTPPAYGAFERNAMGWLDPIVLDGPVSASLEEIQSSNEAYLIPTNKTTEFFLLENRQQTGWDKYIPGHGMLIWHIDFVQSVWDQNEVNNTKSHQYVDIVEANNNPNGQDLATMGGYPFPGTTNKTSFTSATTPALKSWAGAAIDMPITAITEKNGIISFDAAGGAFEFDTPSAPTLSAKTDGTITISWKADPRALDYILNIYKRVDGKAVYLGGYKDFRTGNVTTHTASGVEPETEYFVTIAAASGKNISEPSDEASVVTPALAYEYITPVAISGLIGSDGNVTFAWHPVKDAVDYRLTVKYETEGADENISVDFGSKSSSVEIPAGWSWSGSTSDLYKSAGYFGKTAPSIKFKSNGATLTTKAFSGPVKNLSFFYAGASASSSSYLTVEGSANGSAWFTIAKVDDLSKHNGKGVKTTIVPEKEANQLRFVYTKDAGNMALDDIEIFVSSKTSGTHADFNRKSVGNTTTHTARVSGDHSVLSFSVEAVDANGKFTKPSEFVRITDITSGVEVAEVITDSEAPVEYFNLQGCPIANPTAGIYIRRQGSSVTKVYIK